MLRKSSRETMLAQVPIDPNELIDTTGVGWEEAVLAGIVLIAAIIAGAFVRRIVRATVLRWSKTQLDFAVFVGRLAGWFVLVLGIAFALLILGIQLGPILLIVGVVAVILFLSARDLMENFGAGIVLQSENSFRIGDLVEIGGETGTVNDITGRTTVLDTYDGKRVRVPNTQVLRNEIVNISEREALRSELVVGLEYGTPLDEARQVLLAAMDGVDGVMSDPNPEALVTEFADSSIAFLVRFWHEPTMHAKYTVTDMVARSIDRDLREHGFVIAFPQLVTWQPETTQADED